MIVRKSLSALAACAVMLAFSLPSTLPAASLVGPGTKVKTGTMINTVAEKKKGKKKGKAKSSKGGTCGAFMYWSKASKKCVDTRVTPPPAKK